MQSAQRSRKLGSESLNKKKTRTPFESVCAFGEFKKISLSGLRLGFRRRRGFGVNADEFAFLTFVFKGDDAVNQSKKRVVFSASDIIARFPFRSALAGENVSAAHLFTAEFFESETLCG
jgi:hypothetical protein